MSLAQRFQRRKGCVKNIRILLAKLPKLVNYVSLNVLVCQKQAYTRDIEGLLPSFVYLP